MFKLEAASHQKAEGWSISQHTCHPLPPPPLILLACPTLSLSHFVYCSTSCTLSTVFSFNNVISCFHFSLYCLYISIYLSLSLSLTLHCTGGFSAHRASCEWRGVVYKNVWHHNFCYYAHRHFFFLLQTTSICCACPSDDKWKYCNTSGVRISTKTTNRKVFLKLLKLLLVSFSHMFHNVILSNQTADFKVMQCSSVTTKKIGSSHIMVGENSTPGSFSKGGLRGGGG